MTRVGDGHLPAASYFNIYKGSSKKKVLLRLSSITFNNEQLETKIKMIQKAQG